MSKIVIRCPECDRPITMHVPSDQPQPDVLRIDTSMVATGLDLHLRYGC